MIRIPRCRTTNGEVIRPADGWFDEAEEQRQAAIDDGADHEVTDVYKAPEVRAALEELFYHKCAYCETRITAGFSWDVEHYRPKGRVAECEIHPGYYWLAYTWENLYPACAFCNQRRKDKPLYHDPTELASAGKLDQFPLANEAERAMSPDDDLTREQPLLLDPCNDHPEEHLTYDVGGHILPRDETDHRATETIRICHLKRRRLRQERARRVVVINHLVSELRSLGMEKEEAIRAVLEVFSAEENDYAGITRAIMRNPDAFITEL